MLYKNFKWLSGLYINSMSMIIHLCVFPSSSSVTPVTQSGGSVTLMFWLSMRKLGQQQDTIQNQQHTHRLGSYGNWLCGGGGWGGL